MAFTITPFFPHSAAPISADIETGGCHIFVWRHHLSVENLAAMCEKENVGLEGKDLCAKRLTERLSSLFMIRKLLGPGVTLAHTPAGCPLLQGSPLHISISHTDGIYAVSLAQARHGIDIERPTPRALRLRARFLNDDEMGISLGNGWTTENEATALWCAKEAAFKCFSSESITHIGQIQFHQLQLGASLTARPDTCSSTAYPVDFTRTDDLIIAVCHP